jgi:hypothetical protein
VLVADGVKCMTGPCRRPAVVLVTWGIREPGTYPYCRECADNIQANAHPGADALAAMRRAHLAPIIYRRESPLPTGTG